MPQEMITGGQVFELAGWATRLPNEEYQKRRPWLEQITNPSFNMELLKNVLTPTTYGSELESPFNNATLVTDGPGDDKFDITQLKLVDILTADDPDCITMEEAVRRGQKNCDWNWGQRLAFKIRDEEKAGKISTDVWPVGLYAVCSKTVWQRGGDRCAWCVVRGEDGFFCDWNWFGHEVDSGSRFPSLAK